MRSTRDDWTRREAISLLNAVVIGSVSTSLVTPRAAWAGEPSAPPQPERGTPNTIENTWIPMKDGVRLAARIWLPKVRGARVPAIFNYCPYVSRLFTRLEDDARFPFFVQHGYAAVRVDIRGSGNSDGLPQDEYVRQEQDDAMEVIAWIARQPWCDGRVGMEGLSWSGFNSLQVAARRPPELKAIITHCSTDDRYADDAHYKGGCVLHDMFDWGTAFLAFGGQAPDPAIVGANGWEQRWRERLEAVSFNLQTWMEHPHYDSFWKHASVAEDYRAITCPVYAIGGWVDGYKNTVFRLLEHLNVPRKGLVGPWTHIYPHQGTPGPAIGYLSEALRWWDHWLKGKDTGLMQEPMLRYWMQHKVPDAQTQTVPGRWEAEAQWPSGRTLGRVLFFDGDYKLGSTQQPPVRCDLDPLQTVGISAGNWCPSGAGGASDLGIEISADQRIDDARSLTFTSPQLTEALEILGAPVISLSLSVDQPVAAIAVRLNEVLPTGESGRVTYGILNLCQRESRAHPTAVVPGERFTVQVALDNCGHRFAAGSRIRVSISTTYWPLILPSPVAVELSVWAGTSYVTLPVRPPSPEDDKLHPFEPAYVPAVAVTQVSSIPGSRHVEWDVASRRQAIHHHVADEVDLLEDIGTRVRTSNDMKCQILDNDPTGASIEYTFVLGWERGELRPTVTATSKVVTTPAEFVLDGRLVAQNGDAIVFTRSWTQRIARMLV